MDNNKIKQTVYRYHSFFKLASSAYNHILPKNRLRAKGVKVSSGVTVLNGVKIKSSGVDNEVVLGDFVRMTNCTIVFYGSHNKIFIDEFSTLNQVELYMEDDHNMVEIGKHTNLCGRADLAAIEGTTIKIGDRCMFSSDLHFRTGDSHSVVDLQGKRINPSKDICIADHVWLGTKVTCLKGVYVARDSVVAATTTLCKRYEQTNCVIAGVPGRIVKTDVNWDVRRLPVEE